ncbi:MAG: M15 family metallopeptidase [Synergistaceae bacterium]|jgi:D-alanyl-D-alanine dipeptidase|nr:M15 family metallopeptidase [Synergistaceae bacterium]
MTFFGKAGFASFAALFMIFLTPPRIAGASPVSPDRNHRLPEGFVYVTDIIPDAILDIRYYGADNFVGERIDSYNAPVAILSREAALALKKASDALNEQGYTIKVFDGYRPASAVAHFVRWAGDPGDTRRKAIHYPDVDKADVFKLGYVARKSGHSRGATVDLTIVDSATGEEADMGAIFDFFGPISAPSSRLVTPEQRKNRDILRNAMTASGFKPLSTEWWHFTLKNEPFPETYFDFPVE